MSRATTVLLGVMLLGACRTGIEVSRAGARVIEPKSGDATIEVYSSFEPPQRRYDLVGFIKAWEGQLELEEVKRRARELGGDAVILHWHRKAKDPQYELGADWLRSANKISATVIIWTR